jgi:hypothetical protein
MAMHPNFDASMNTQQRLGLVRKTLAGIFKRYNEEAIPPIFELRDEFIDSLRSVELLKVRKFRAVHVGVHPKNRYGDGLLPSHVTKLIGKFTLKGFSKEELGIPRASEVPPVGHPRHLQFVKFVNECVEKSDGVLPPYDHGELEIVSGQKTHTNQGCRCVLKGAPCDDPRIAVNGKYNLDKIRHLRSSYAQVCEEGMTWEVVPWEVEDEFEYTMDLIQESGNAALTTAQQETRLEICLKMLNTYTRLSRGVDLTDEEAAPLWQQVLQEAVRGEPEFVDEVPDMLEFVKLVTRDELQELVDFTKPLKHSPRTCNPLVLSALMKLPLGEDGQGHRVLKMDHKLINTIPKTDSKRRSAIKQ